jgi:predicted DNA-binding transcriptional regulator YafY
MSKVERLYHLHNILNQRRTPISRQDLMERLECSQATLYRLVGELRDFLGAPIEQDPDTRGFYYDRSYEQPFDLPGIWISPGELQALLTARQVLSNVQPGLLDGELESLQGRITSLLQKKGVEPESGESPASAPEHCLPWPAQGRGKRTGYITPAADAVPQLLVPGCLVPPGRGAAQFCARADTSTKTGR